MPICNLDFEGESISSFVIPRAIQVKYLTLTLFNTHLENDCVWPVAQAGCPHSRVNTQSSDTKKGILVQTLAMGLEAAYVEVLPTYAKT